MDIKADSHIMERRGFFMEDLRSQIHVHEHKAEINEDQIVQLFYSSVGMSHGGNGAN